MRPNDRRWTVGIILGVALAASTSAVVPAAASHCGPADPSACPHPASVWVLEGIGFVCNEARGVVNPRCRYQTDALTPVLPGSIDQGLYWPGVGPSATGPFSFRAGADLNVPSSLCVASVGGVGCVFDARGTLEPGRVSGQPTFGAYCGSSRGVGSTTFRSGGGELVMTSSFGWEQSAATILPLAGRISSGSPSGMTGATLSGFVSSRGVSGGGNCGLTQATTQFQVEGVVVVY